MAYAPICVFAYNRPKRLARLLANLKDCELFDSSPLYIFADGPKPDRSDDVQATLAVRKLAEGFQHGQVKIIASEMNRGLANSVRRGVDYCTESHGRVIVLEDDLEVDRHCLTYFNNALDKYEKHLRVQQISGFSFPTTPRNRRGERESYFLPFISTWGWATWEDRWRECTWQSSEALAQLKAHPALKERFNLNNSYDYYRMLEKQVRGESDSWGILWNWHVFQRDGVVLYPAQTLVENHGMGDGTHGSRDLSAHFGQVQTSGRESLPEETMVDLGRYGQVTDQLRQMGRLSPRDYANGAVRRLTRLIRTKVQSRRS